MTTILQTLYMIVGIEWHQSPLKYIQNEACQVDINIHLSEWPRTGDEAVRCGIEASAS